MEKIATAFDKAGINVQTDMKSALSEVNNWVSNNSINKNARVSIKKFQSTKDCDDVDVCVSDQKNGRRFIIRKDGKIKANIRLDEK